MMKHFVCAAVIVASGVIAAPSTAQSLADVARQEEARRKNPAAKKAKKSFSNADLAPSEIAPPAPPATTAAAPAGCVESASQGKCVAAEEVIAKSEAAPAQDPQVKTSEKSVRDRATRIRGQLLKAQQEFDSISRTADDPSRSAGERAAASRLASQRETMLASIERQWRALEKQVADEQLPREWLDPTPLLSMRSRQ